MRKTLLILAILSTTFLFAQEDNALMDDKNIMEFAVYFLENDTFSPDHVKEFVKTSNLNIELIDEFPQEEDVKGVQLFITEVKNVSEEFPPMDLEYLKYSNQGLTTFEMETLQLSSYALVFDFLYEKSKFSEAVEIAHQLIYDLVEDKQVAIYDSETRETFSKSFWSAKRISTGIFPVIANHITIHFYQKDEYCRAITLGMLKFGLPDIVMEDLSCRSSLSLTSLINLTAQTLLEQGSLNDNKTLDLNIANVKNNEFREFLESSVYENAKQQATITIENGVWESGDPQNRLYKIAFEGDNPQVQHDELLSTLFGSEDKITTLRHNEEILAASNRAKEKIPELYKAFNKGFPFDRSLLIKFPFENKEGDREWMWVEVLSWKKNTVTGLLQNEPALVTNLKSGQKVKKNIKNLYKF